MATVAAIALMGWVGWTRAESVSIVQVTDMRGQSEYQVMGREEFAAIQKEIKEETTIFLPIVAECKKEWEANKDNTLPFQGNRIKPRSAKKVGADFMDREKAQKKRSQMEDRASSKQAEELDKESKKSQSSNTDEVSKEMARTKAFDEAFEMIAKKMGEKLGRPVPRFGLLSGSDTKTEAKKDEKKDEKKDKKPKTEKKGN